MTDKERLEKAKKILNHIKGYGVYDGNDDIEIFEWLIKQAERVQEYDRELISLEDNKHYVSEMLAKNKRYREAIEVAIQNIVACKNLGVKFALKILEQALEGEE